MGFEEMIEAKARAHGVAVGFVVGRDDRFLPDVY
jgi:hypothetical protein